MTDGNETRRDDAAGQHVPRVRRYGALVCGAALSFVASTAAMFFRQFTFIGLIGCALIVALGVWALGSTKLRAFGGGVLIGSLFYFTWSVLQYLGLIPVLRV